MRALALATLLLLVAGCSSPAPETDAADTPHASEADAPVHDGTFPIHIRGDYTAAAGCLTVPASQAPQGIVSDLQPVPPEAAGHPFNTSGGNAVVNTEKCVIWLDSAGNVVGTATGTGTVPQGAAQVFVTAQADVGAGAMGYTIEVTA